MSYGVVIVDAAQRVLLVQPANGFGGYKWTFPKRSAQEGVAPEQTAINAGLIETGHSVRIIKKIPGLFKRGSAVSEYFLAESLGRAASPSSETAKCECFSILATAESAILESSNIGGRERDVSVRKAAEDVFFHLEEKEYPFVDQNCWYGGNSMPLVKVPPHARLIDVNLSFTTEDFQYIIRGFYPLEESQKWFIYEDSGFINCNRSWTGFCFYRLPYEHRDDGLTLIRKAYVNNDHDQVTLPSGFDYHTEIKTLLQSVVDMRRFHFGDWLRTSYNLQNSLLTTFSGNYLGNPGVVESLISPMFDASVAYALGKGYLTDIEATVYEICNAYYGVGSTYKRVEPWHSSGGMIKALQRHAVRELQDRPEVWDGVVLQSAMWRIAIEIIDLARAYQHWKHSEAELADELGATKSYLVRVMIGLMTDEWYESAYTGGIVVAPSGKE